MTYWRFFGDKAAAVSPGQKPLQQGELDFAPFPQFGIKGFGSKEYNAACRERLVQWLDVRGRDAVNLVAAQDIVRTKVFEQEMVERFPHDPRVCMAMISSKENMEMWIERFIAAESDNPAGYLRKAEMLAAANKVEAAITAMQQAAELKVTPDYHLRERLLAVRAAAQAIGLPEWETAMQCSAVRMLAESLEAVKLLKILRSEIKAAKDSADQPRVVRFAEMSATIGFQMSHADILTSLGQLVGTEMQIMGLSELAAGERLAEAKRQKAAFSAMHKRSMESDGSILKASGPQLMEYVDRLLRDGELPAEVWLGETVASQPKRTE